MSFLEEVSTKKLYTSQVILEMLENYPTPLRELILAQNHISDSLQDDIENCLKVDDDLSSVGNGTEETFSSS